MKLTIIGAGPGGYTAAFAAAEKGIEVTLIDMAEIGGTCLNRGCIPTKTLRSSADAVMLAGRLPEYGVETGPAKICLQTQGQCHRHPAHRTRKELLQTQSPLRERPGRSSECEGSPRAHKGRR